MIGRILPITGIIVPFWLVRAMVGWAETIEVLPAILVVGASFSLTQYLWSNHVDSNLVDIAGGIVSLLATVVFLRYWRPKRVWRFEHERTAAPGGAGGGALHKYTVSQIVRAWMPFAILSITVLVWGLPSIKGAMNRATTPIWNVPWLHNAVTRAAPVVTKLTPEAARFDFNWLSATGTGCFIAAIIAGLVLGVRPVQLAKIFWYTLKRMKLAVIAISFMLGLGYTTRYSGLDAVLGLAFTRTGWLFPFFGTYLGWLGVALTGSDTSSNALFGSLQRITAQQLNLDPILMCAANSAGGVMGKMVDAQSITVATSATNQVGNEGSIFRYVFWHSIALGAIVGVIVLLYAYVFAGGVPHGLTIVK
jgi:lactate permease